MVRGPCSHHFVPIFSYGTDNMQAHYMGIRSYRSGYVDATHQSSKIKYWRWWPRAPFTNRDNLIRAWVYNRIHCLMLYVTTNTDFTGCLIKPVLMLKHGYVITLMTLICVCVIINPCHNPDAGSPKWKRPGSFPSAHRPIHAMHHWALNRRKITAAPFCDRLINDRYFMSLGSCV